MRKLIVLYRGDLIKLKEDTKLEDIQLCDIRYTSMTIDESEYADMIIFIDTDGNNRTLKSRYSRIDE